MSDSRLVALAEAWENQAREARAHRSYDLASGLDLCADSLREALESNEGDTLRSLLADVAETLAVTAGVLQSLDTRTPSVKLSGYEAITPRECLDRADAALAAAGYVRPEDRPQDPAPDA